MCSQGWGQAEGQDAAALVPFSLILVGPTWAARSAKPLSNKPGVKSSIKQTKGGPFLSPAEMQNEMVALVPPSL